MKRHITLVLTALTISLAAGAQSRIVKEFRPVCDSLNTLMEERTGVDGKLRMKAVMSRGGILDFYFTESLGDFPFRTGDTQWFRDKLKSLFPQKYSGYELGEIYSRNVDIQQIEVAPLGNKGRPQNSLNRCEAPAATDPIVRRVNGPVYRKGLSGRTIALWQSHGIYFDNKAERWQWQRPFMFQTGEDMFTQSFVLPFLVPMLENAGAYVMLPRERDIQRNEVIADNDPTKGGRGTALYSENGRWKNAGVGFADIKGTYSGYDNPFIMGTARKADCIPHDSGSDAASVEWRPEIPESGEYAVYISYKSLPESSSSAIYRVHHRRGISEFDVNQKIGGGTWVYLGTFEFAKGNSGFVTLEARSPKGSHVKGSIVTADAVRFGGGMGSIARSAEGSDVEAVTSGLPRYAEGARYWLQWAGTDKTIYTPNELEDDYKDDYMSRGDWVDWISGGSYMNPEREGKGIPVDLSFGFHSDAGVTPDDSIIGTLAIYTYKSENKTELPGGESRMTSREFADIVQSQIVSDIRAGYNEEWSRRQLWDRGYRESRTPSCPSMLLELLSHQNFADMKYGLDPSFRFTVSRSVYKGMLKYLSNRYGVSYTVQPLPVKDLGVRFSGEGKAMISWSERKDLSEPTADASGYILYTRIDDGAYDMGREISEWNTDGERLSYTVDIKPGHIYSFMIEAVNGGGRSFPSETACIGIPADNCARDTVVIVNNFDRVGGPSYIDTPVYAGFDNGIDSGVPYIRDIAFVGEMYEMRRDREWINNDNPGFGGSAKDRIGSVIAGNTFDYAYVHGRAVLDTGHPFISCSRDVFCNDSTFMNSASSVDIICGKQITTSCGDRLRYSVFPEHFRKAISDYAAKGGNILISGANIASDAWDQIYPFAEDKEEREATREFIKEVLGYRWITNHGSRIGEVSYVDREIFGSERGVKQRFYNEPNEECYCVETPDGITPTGKGKVFLRYSDTDIAAGIYSEKEGYRTVCIGFPIETCYDEDGIFRIISSTLEFFNR